MRFSAWFRPPRRLLALFLVSTLVPASALVWLGWRLLGLDRSLARQHVQDRLERAADQITASLERELEGLTARLPALLTSPPDALEPSAAVAALTPSGIDATTGARLPYVPTRPTRVEPPAAVWTRGEILEFQRQDAAGAVKVFRQLSRSEDPAVRAGARVRLARNLRRSQRADEALEVYAELAGLGDVPVGGDPSALVARQARCALLSELDRRADLRQEAEALAADLHQARWRLDRASLLFHWHEARRWLAASGAAETADPPEWRDGLARAAAIDEVWREWRATRRAQSESTGRRSVWIDGRGVLVLWRGSPDRLLVFAAGPGYIDAEWRRVWASHRTVVTLVDAEGHRVLAAQTGGHAPEVLRTALDARLPWTVRVASADPDQELAVLAGRRQLLLAGVGLLAFLIVAGGYLVARAVQREQAAARLQTEFVAAVSHEFRTPLTSMRHLIELLRTGRPIDDDRRGRYYEVLSNDTERLYRFVETLLDFGRMEAGVEHYQFESIDTASAVSRIVDDFRNEVVAGRHPIVVQPNGELPLLRADREAFTRALWNLLDNAAKYSPPETPIHVRLDRDDGRVAISVRDEGPGIAPADRHRIFQKFVRGAGARESGVKGTGVGLAMVDRIVHAHAGEMRLESEPGRGCTFTMLLPAAESRA
jgi:signal transduction histidine kinase